MCPISRIGVGRTHVDRSKRRVRRPNLVTHPLFSAPGPESLVSTESTSFIVGYETPASGFQHTSGRTPPAPEGGPRELAPYHTGCGRYRLG